MHHLRIAPVTLLFALLFTGCAATSQRISLSPQEQATQLLDQARTSRDPHRQAGEALSAAQTALTIATDRTAPATGRTIALHTYNEAVKTLVLALEKHGALPDGPAIRTIQGADGATFQLRIITTGRATRDPSAFDRLISADTVKRKHMKSDIQRSGLGAPFIGVSDDKKHPLPNRPPTGFATPLTAVAAFQRPSHSTVPVTLTFLDPREADTITLDRSTFQLRGDFTASLAYFPPVRTVLFGIVAMFRSDITSKRSGLYMMEPYDPEKIPVLFVHGLMSSPQAFVDFMNELNSDPAFRRRYQPWVYFYPTGGPIAANALHLRNDLDALAKRYPLKRNIIVVGHSMGGILTNMQVINTRRQLWDTLFGTKADSVYNQFPADSLLKRVLIFKANPYISRVIFIATPHRGSKLADLTISAIAGSFIRMPANLVADFNPQLRSAVRDISPSLRTIPTSIIGLSPRNVLLKGVNQFPITVPSHSIIGNQGKDEIPLADSSDGIVPYWSSHLDASQSELIVPTGHDAFNNPSSVKEVLRILALQQ